MGQGVETDYSKTRTFFEKAEAQNFQNPDMYFVLGVFYLEGKGGIKNIFRGSALLKKSAELGNNNAKAMLKKLNIN